MKTLFTFGLLILTLAGILSMNSAVFGQDLFQTIDVIPVNTNLKTSGSVQASVSSVNLTGNFNELIIPVSFPDRPEMNQCPIIVTNQAFPLLGVFQDETSLKDFVHNHNDTIPEDLWYGPGFNHYFTTESGGMYNVNFQFVKKTEGKYGTRYSTSNNFSHWNNNVYYHRAEILNEVVQNVYGADPGIFDGVDLLHFTFEGIDVSEFYDGSATGTVDFNMTFTAPNGHVIYSNKPVSLQMYTRNISHEYMHIIGALAGNPNGFDGFPDRGYDRSVYDGSTTSHSNMSFLYDMMEHNLTSDPSQYSLYGIKPLTSYDLIFLGWIKPDEILPIDQNNFANYSDIKLADVNYPLTQQQKDNGYHRVVKLMVPGQSSEYFLVEYHAASEFDKMFNNYDEYQNGGGYNTGVLVWHVKEMTSQINSFSDNLIELLPAVPYNSWYGNPIPNDSYAGHGKFYRPPLPDSGQAWWNGNSSTNTKHEV